jgi:hypothetical protein
MQPIKLLPIPFLLGIRLVLTLACFKFSTSQSPKVVGATVTLDVIGKQLVQQFHHVNIGGFLLYPVGSSKQDTSHFLIHLDLLLPP